MNIFVLDQDPVIAAEMHCDKHAVKMVLEVAQLLSTAHRVLDGEMRIVPQNGRNYKRWILEDEHRENVLYKSTHVNHPCAIWVRESSANYAWAVKMLNALLKEYHYRYGYKQNRHHKVLTSGIYAALFTNPHNITISEQTPFALAMPDDYKTDDPVESYRMYYLNDKRDLLQYTRRPMPDWVQEALCQN